MLNAVRKSRVRVIKPCDKGGVALSKRRDEGFTEKVSFKLRLEGGGGTGSADSGWKYDSR